MKKRETLFKERVHKDLKAINVATKGALWFVKTQQVCIRGTPDELLCVHGRFVALELKASFGDRLDALQWHNLDAISKAGGFGLRADPSNWSYLLGYLQLMAQGEHIAASIRMALCQSIGPRPITRRRSASAAKLPRRAVFAK